MKFSSGPLYCAHKDHLVCCYSFTDAVRVVLPADLMLIGANRGEWDMETRERIGHQEPEQVRHPRVALAYNTEPNGSVPLRFAPLYMPAALRPLDSRLSALRAVQCIGRQVSKRARQVPIADRRYDEGIHVRSRNASPLAALRSATSTMNCISRSFLRQLMARDEGSSR